MQIRLTVLGPRSGRSARACDVLVTAPAGTPLAAVASGLAAAVAASGADVGTSTGSGSTVLYAGQERLDAQRCALGEPPLVDGAVLSLHAPAEPGRHPGMALEPLFDASAHLHVVAGPDAGGVHLLHGGQIRVGRSADADVPLDDPDVSRLHCAVTVAEDGRVTVADLGSTNGTTLDGEPVGERPAALRPGALLRVGESALRLEPASAATRGAGAPTPADAGPIPRSLATVPDGEGHLRVSPGTSPEAESPLSPPHAGPAGFAPPPSAPPGARQDVTHAVPFTVPGAAASRTGPAASEEDLLEHDGGPGRGGRRGRGIGAWARRLAGGRADQADASGYDDDQGGAEHDGRWPDPSEILLTVLGPGPRLWERGPDHPDALAVRLGTADRTAGPPAPVTVDLREVGALGLAGPRPRLDGLTRAVVAQLAALHAPAVLEIVLISVERAPEPAPDWSWLGWLPHLRPAHGQDCRLLLAHDREQAAARTAELVRRLDDGPLGPGWATADRRTVAEAAARYAGPYSLVIVDGDPGTPALRETTARLAAGGPVAGVHLLCLADTPPAAPTSPVSTTAERARAASPAFARCGAVALLSGDVATTLRVVAPWPSPAPDRPAPSTGGPDADPAPRHEVLATVDAVSGAWAERFARALAPLRPAGAAAATPGSAGSRRVAASLPRTARLLDELGLARATPASLTARWASAADAGGTAGGRLGAIVGSSLHGPLALDLAAESTHLLVEGGPGTGKTELLRTLAASLAAGDRPDRVSLVLVDGCGVGADGPTACVPEPRGEGRSEPRTESGSRRGEGLRPCTDLPHVSTHLAATDPVRMRVFAQALASELKRRAELLGDLDFEEWHVRSAVAARLVAPRRAGGQQVAEARGDLDPSTTRTVRLRQRAAGDEPSGGPVDALGAAGRADALPRLVVLVDDFDDLVAPALGSTGRPAAGSMVRALEAVARDGARLGVHLVTATGRPDRTADTAAARAAGLHITLDLVPEVQDGPVASESAAEGPAAGRGRLTRPDGTAAPFQAGRVSGRIPRTSTLRPTVVPLDWERAGDPPARRPLRELGNGPTDLALLASALQRAAQSAASEPAPPLV